MRIARLPSKRRNNIILIILLIGLPLLFFASYEVIQLITRAGADLTPKNALISNITTSSATITWVTETQTRGSLVPYLGSTAKSTVVDKRGNTKRYTHYVELTDLEPNTTYQFEIVSDTTKYYDDKGKKFTFKTAPITADTPTPNPIHGAIPGVTGDDVLIFVVLKDKSTYPVSTIIPNGGNWIMDLSALRKVSDKSLVISSNSTNLVLVVVTGSGKGGVVEGSYSELFDSNGKLKETNPITLGTSTTLYSNFPTAALFTVGSVVDPDPVDPDPVDPDPVDPDPVDPDPVDPDPVKPDPVIPDPVVVEEDFTREFRLVNDLVWIDMVKGGSTIASGDSGEDTVQITNLTDTGFTVVWVSQAKEEGYVKYGTSLTSLTNDVVDERDGLSNKGSYYVHSVDLTRLQPETKYYFNVISGKETWKNGNAGYSVSTFATLNSPPPFQSITGKVEPISSGADSLVVGYIKDIDSTGSSGESLKMSTLADENGKWILSIADSRILDGSAYYEHTDGDDMYFDVLSTVNFTPKKESVEGITDRDIVLTIPITSGSAGSFTKIERLKNYGIVGTNTQ